MELNKYQQTAEDFKLWLKNEEDFWGRCIAPSLVPFSTEMTALAEAAWRASRRRYET